MRFLVAGLVALLLTYVMLLVEVLLRAKATFKATLNLPCLFYLVVLAFGNVLMTLFALPQLDGRISEPLRPWVQPLLAAFAGCFAFHGVLSNMNITFFQKKLLTFDDWIAKARSLAAGAANEKQGALDAEEDIAIARRLAALHPGKLNAYVAEYLPGTDIRELESRARANGADAPLYKALELATKDRRKAKAILRAHKRA
jgi:hypothetical protein